MSIEKQIINGKENHHTEPLSDSKSSYISVKMQDSSVLSMDIEEYILGVVLGEMPASFELEALKAQAVVARTFAANNIKSDYKHQDCDICTDSNCCQNYVDPKI